MSRGGKKAAAIPRSELEILKANLVDHNSPTTFEIGEDELEIDRDLGRLDEIIEWMHLVAQDPDLEADFDNLREVASQIRRQVAVMRANAGSYAGHVQNLINLAIAAEKHDVEKAPKDKVQS